MKVTNLIAIAMALALGLSQPGVALAQENGFPFPQPAPAPDPTPVNPSHLVLEGGKLMVVVGGERHFGWRIGEVIPVTVVISTDPGVKVNIAGWQRKVISQQGSDFEMVEPPLVIEETKNGKHIFRVQFKIRSWVVKDQKAVLTFAADFHYAVDSLPNGEPYWRGQSTPDFHVVLSNTAGDSEKELLEGDMGDKPSPTPPLVVPLRVGGYLLISLLPMWLLWKLWRRVRPVRVVPANEVAWTVFDAVLEESRHTGMRYEHLEKVSEALRAYLGIEAVPLDEVAVPLERFFENHPNRVEMLVVAVNALTKLQAALYSDDKQGLTETEAAELVAELESLVPRP